MSQNAKVFLIQAKFKNPNVYERDNQPPVQFQESWFSSVFTKNILKDRFSDFKFIQYSRCCQLKDYLN